MTEAVKNVLEGRGKAAAVLPLFFMLFGMDILAADAFGTEPVTFEFAKFIAENTLVK